MTKSTMMRWPREIGGDSQMIACSWEWGLLALWPLSISERSTMMRKMMKKNSLNKRKLPRNLRFRRKSQNLKKLKSKKSQRLINQKLKNLLQKSQKLKKRSQRK